MRYTISSEQDIVPQRISITLWTSETQAKPTGLRLIHSAAWGEARRWQKRTGLYYRVCLWLTVLMSIVIPRVCAAGEEMRFVPSLHPRLNRIHTLSSKTKWQKVYNLVYLCSSTFPWLSSSPNQHTPISCFSQNHCDLISLHLLLLLSIHLCSNPLTDNQHWSHSRGLWGLRHIVVWA